MKNPYKELPDYAFWKRSVCQPDAAAVDPVVSPPFRINPADAVATAGSCFAQHIARTLVRQGFNFLVTESGVASAGADESFSARFGNVYTVRQLLQLFQRAYGLFVPAERSWTRDDGKLVDPFRPRVSDEGFDTLQALLEDQAKHLAAVREMFENCRIFIFTLGLTEGWTSAIDGAVYPIAPGVVGSGSEDFNNYRFENFAVDGMIADLTDFIDKLRTVNPEVGIIFTVSPVPLVATYENRHVLVSNTYSKSALRVVAEVASKSRDNVTYFPSYEIITGAHQRSRFYAEDLREVTPEGVATVMSIFSKHFLTAAGDGAKAAVAAPAPQRIPQKPPEKPKPQASPNKVARTLAQDDADARERLAQLNKVICDEEILDPSSSHS